MKPCEYATKLSELIKYPSTIVTLDFETYYDTANDYTLKKMSTEAYVRDPRFLTHGLSVKLGHKPSHYLAGDNRVRKFLKSCDLSRAMCIAHNARFDGFILSEVYGIRPAMWVDTMSLANVVLGNNIPAASLSALARRFLPKELWKQAEALTNVDGKRKLTLQEQKELGIYANRDTDSCHALAQIFMDILKQRPLEVPMTDMIIRMFTDPALILDTDLLLEINKTEKLEKEKAVDHCIAPNLKALRSNDQFATMLQGCGIKVPMKISPTTGEPTYAFAKTDKEFTDMVMHDDKTVRDLVKARLRVKSSIEETRAKSYHEVGMRGTWPVALNVSGAKVTHRLTGSSDGGGNPQNLSNVDKSRLRNAIYPPPGYHLLVIDSSNIDLRVAMTLAGETDVVDQWRDPSFDFYRTFAAYLHDIELAAVTHKQRKLGKVSLLSLQYGSGAVTFRAMAWNRGVELSMEEAAAIVVKYRRAFPKIVAMWKQLNYILRKLQRGEVVETRYDHLVKANPHTVSGCPGFDVAGGMPITYPKLRFEYDHDKGKPVLAYTKYEKDNSGTGMARPVAKYIYGAKAFGHICQNGARNLVMPQTLAVDHWLRGEVHPGCRSVMSVHDEGGYLIPDDVFAGSVSPDDVLAGAVEVMCTSPEWWPEIPLTAGGWCGKGSYGDAK